MRPSVRLEAPAKVNLRLRVLARESSGYHSLESLFCALSLTDSLEVERTGRSGVELEVEGGIETGPPEENLVVRAARRFFAGLGEEPALRIRLAKRVPSAAGLGGGSSDAAAALRALSALFEEPFPNATLLQWAIELGSDVPFFLCGSPYALGWSRGERLLSLPPLPSRPVLVAHPGEPMPTGGAFARIAEHRGGEFRPEAFACDLESVCSWEGVARLAENDFGAVAEERLPRLRAAREALVGAGATIALLAGSGASLFGVFETEAARDAAGAAVEALGFRIWPARTLERMPVPVPGSGPGARVDPGPDPV